MPSDSITPAVATLLSLAVAYFGIHRADKRERDKQRRDDLRKIAMEFLSLGVHAEKTQYAVAIAYACDDAKSTDRATEEGIRALDALESGVEALELQLELFGERSLERGLSEYAHAARGMQTHIYRARPPEGCVMDGERFANHCIEPVHQKRLQVVREFANELQRLRVAGGSITRLWRWLSRLPARLSKRWSQL